MARRNKFGAIATHVCAGCFVWGDGKRCIACRSTKFIRFDSKAEAKRFATLCLLEKGGVIRNLVRQPKFPVTINGVEVFTYIADFAYDRAGHQITEDVKGVATDTFKLKLKCVEAQYGIKVEVVAA